MLHLKSAFFESEFQAFAQYEDDRLFFNILYNVSESAEIEWNDACEAIWFFNIFHQNLLVTTKPYKPVSLDPK